MISIETLIISTKANPSQTMKVPVVITTVGSELISIETTARHSARTIARLKREDTIAKATD